MKSATVIREAREEDVEAIQEIFHACYGDHYAYPEYYDEANLKQLIYDRDVVFLVAEDREEGRIFGTASVILDIGAWGDLIGEFGRLAVHPDGRGRQLGNRLMEGRMERVRQRLHIGVVENRATHPYSQKISDRFGFVPVGFLPSKMLISKRESIALYAQYFGDALKLRRNHPHIIPEAWPLADEVLGRCGLSRDPIVDTSTAPYRVGQIFEIEEMTSEGYTSLLHFERGRVSQREIIGPVKLHAGLFQLQVSHYQYLLAKREGHLLGGIGYFINEHEKSARIIELVSVDSDPVRGLLEEVVSRFADHPGVDYVEVDVSAHAPAMQRTLLELGFLPAAYLPAMSFHRVERIDGLRMVQLFQPFDLESVVLHETTKPVASLVIDQFREKMVVPEIAAAVPGTSLFEGLNDEQARELAGVAGRFEFGDGEEMILEGSRDGLAILLLDGDALISIREKEGNVARVVSGEIVGEMALLHGTPHHATATASGEVKAAVFSNGDVEQLIRRRPDIGVIIYRNLATQMGDKLFRMNLGEP